MKGKAEDEIYWADKKEVISTNKPLLLLLMLMKKLPASFVFVLIYPIAFFYFACSKSVRAVCSEYQKQIKEFSKDSIKMKVSVFKQILSFTLCVMEKMEGWLGKFHYEELITHDDDLKALQNQLEQGKGALLIGSHLGNLELLRSLSSFGEDGVKKEVPVIAIMEMKATEQFNNTLKVVNPNAGFHVIDPSEIGPDTIIYLQENIEKGGLVVVTGDRTSARSRDRILKNQFLGKEADFPSGVYILASLLKVPIYFLFGLRTKSASLRPVYNIYVEKSNVDFDCARSERNERIEQLCKEFVSKLEKYCVQFPYQWYNFYKFWSTSGKSEVEK